MVSPTRLCHKSGLAVSASVGIDVRLFSDRGKPDAARAARRGTPAVSRDAGPPAETTLHATVVALDGRGLLILGASGSGKSGLALRLMALGARLVADDRTILARRDGALLARAPVALRGLIEARGVGLLRAEPLPEAALAVAADLDAAAEARMPQPREIALLGVALPLIPGRGAPNLDATLIQLLRCGRAD